MRTIGFNAAFCRRLALRWLLPAATFGLLVLSGLGIGQPAEARDRPGTPNKQVLYLCDYPAPNFPPVLCAQFNNTTEDVVYIETWTTRNGQPFPLYPSTFTCKGINLHETKTSHGDYFAPAGEICYSPTAKYGRKPNDPDFVYYLQTPPLDWGTQYCMRFRARRVSDGVVSANWSDYACTTVPPKPAFPTPPVFTVSFSGSQMLGQSTNNAAKPGSTAQVIPSKLIVTPSGGAGVALYQLTLNGGQMQQWTGPGGVPHTYDAPGTSPTNVLQLCAYNASGHRCSQQTINMLAQGVVPVTYGVSRPKSSKGFPVATSAPGSRVFGSPTQTSAQTASMSGTDMPGDDYSSKPISGSAVDCQNMCNADGKCLAWTWVKPGVQNAQAMCWLKNGVPPSRPNPNAVSGIKAGSPAVH
jgi:hypothetical protein